MSKHRLYRWVLSAAQPIMPAYLAYRRHKGKEIFARLGERYGLATRPRPEGKLLWIHAASVGESTSVLPLVEKLLRDFPHLYIMVTTGSVTSAEMLEKRLPQRAFHQFIPLDTPSYSKNFLNHWKPDAALWVESELWPCMLHEMRKKHIPAARLNARLSEKSALSWQKHKRFFRRLQKTFQLTLAMSISDADRLADLGVTAVQCVGNLKFAAPTPLYAEAADTRLHFAIGDRPTWLMASSHKGEEALAVAVHQALTPTFPDLLTLIAPRHPARAAEILALLPANTPQRSQGGLPQADKGFYLADTMGEMPLFYRNAQVACVGGSFAPKGGHNPLESVQCNTATLIGTDISKCRDIVTALQEKGAIIHLQNAEDLASVVQDLLQHPHKRQAFIEAGKKATQHQQDLLEKISTALAPILHALS